MNETSRPRTARRDREERVSETVAGAKTDQDSHKQRQKYPKKDAKSEGKTETERWAEAKVKQSDEWHLCWSRWLSAHRIGLDGWIGWVVVLVRCTCHGPGSEVAPHGIVLHLRLYSYCT